VRPAAGKFAALLLGLALGACSAVPLQAGVISNFDAPTPGDEDDPTGVVAFQATEGQLKITAPFNWATDPAALRTTYGSVWWGNQLPTKVNQTLELRVDVLSAPQDDIFTLVCWEANVSPPEGYFLMADRNELWLLKFYRLNPDHTGYSFPFWEQMPAITGPVTLSLWLMQTGDRGLSLLITATVMERGSGAVLFQRSFLDTPAADPVVPSPGPHGMLSRLPEPGRAFTGGTGWRALGSSSSPTANNRRRS
jgi:hypothetical protein